MLAFPLITVKFHMWDYCKVQMKSCPKTIIKLKLTKAQWSKWKYLLNIGMKSDFFFFFFLVAKLFIIMLKVKSAFFEKKRSILISKIPIIMETKKLQEQLRRANKIKNKKKKKLSSYKILWGNWFLFHSSLKMIVVADLIYIGYWRERVGIYL